MVPLRSSLDSHESHIKWLSARAESIGIARPRLGGAATLRFCGAG